MGLRYADFGILGFEKERNEPLVMLWYLAIEQLKLKQTTFKNYKDGMSSLLLVPTSSYGIIQPCSAPSSENGRNLKMVTWVCRANSGRLEFVRTLRAAIPHVPSFLKILSQCMPWSGMLA